MRKHFQKTISAVFAVALLGSAVMLSVSSAEGPYRHAGQNAFDGPPVGHPDKALIQVRWLEACESERAPGDQAAFDWQLNRCDACPKCGFKDSQVMPVVLDAPELLGTSDTSAIEVIKRKLGINAFRGSIFEEPDFSAVQVFSADAPPRLGSYVCELSATGVCSSGECGTFCDVLHKGGTAATTSTALNSGDVACSQETCTALSACTAESAQCDPACDGGSTCSSTKGPGANGAAMAALQSAPHGRAFASTIAEDPIAALRRASLDLDEAAMKLEVSDRYADADALREAAQHLRIKARQFKAGASVSTTSYSNASSAQATWYAPPAYCPQSYIDSARSSSPPSN